MSRSNAKALDHAPAKTTYDESDKPTRPLPVLTLADLMRELGGERGAAEEDSTLMIGAEENRKLLESAFAQRNAEGPASGISPIGEVADVHIADDQPTMIAPSPVFCEPPRVSRPPALRALVFTSPPPKPVVLPLPAAVAAACAPPPSAPGPRMTAETAKAMIDAKAALEPRRPTFLVRLPERNTKNLVVAGIWATALTLFALLLFMATAA